MKALIVDDNLGTALTTKFSFDRHGIDADYCLNAKEAKKKLKSSTFDYILIDIIINGDRENGIYLCKYIKNNKINIKVIFITGCEEDSMYATEAKSLAPVVFKTFNPKKLAKQILDGEYNTFYE